MPHAQCHQSPLRVDRDDAVEITLILQTCLLCIACRMQCRAQSPSAPCDKNIAIDFCFSTGVVMLNCVLIVLCCLCSFVIYDLSDGRWHLPNGTRNENSRTPALHTATSRFDNNTSYLSTGAGGIDLQQLIRFAFVGSY